MKKRIVCFGDSNTWGYNGTDASRFEDDVRWTGVLSKALGNGYSIVEEGQNARTTNLDDHVHPYRNGKHYLMPCLESHMPIDYLLIMLGTNDTKERFGCNAYVIASSAAQLVTVAQNSACGPNGNPPGIILISPVHIQKRYLEVPEMAQTFGPHAAEKSLEFAKWFRMWAKRTGCAFFDAATVAQADAAVDGVHMNAENHSKLGRALAEKILELEQK